MAEYDIESHYKGTKIRTLKFRSIDIYSSMFCLNISKSVTLCVILKSVYGGYEI